MLNIDGVQWAALVLIACFVFLWWQLRGDDEDL